MSSMMLSSEQMQAVNAGSHMAVSWHEIARPVGPHPIPAWCKGVHVDWADGYMNSPRVGLKVIGNVRHWPEQRYVCEDGKFYRSRNEDGRMEQYAHGGRVALDTIQMFQSEDGTLRQYRREGPQWFDPTSLPPGCKVWPQHGPEPGQWVKVEKLCTTRQDGFGGAHIHLDMEDGTTVVLRGPWHTSGPDGYAEVRYVDMTRDMRWRRRGEPWHRVGGGGGLFLRDDVFAAIMSRFAAHLRLFAVTRHGFTRIEPVKPEWDAPKCVIYEREWQAKQDARKAQAVPA